MVDARMQCLGSSDKHWLTQKVSTEGHEDRVGSWLFVISKGLPDG